MAFDDSGNGVLTPTDFVAAFQQAGIGGGLLSRTVIDAIGRRFNAARKMGNPVGEEMEKGGAGVKLIVYKELLKLLKTALEKILYDESEEGQLEKEEREKSEDLIRKKAWDDELTIKQQAEVASRRRKVGERKDDNFNDPFFTKGKPIARTNISSKSAWRGVKGNVPTLNVNNGKSQQLSNDKKRTLPKYLRNVSSKIKSDLETVRDYRTRATTARMEVAKEVVAGRRLERFNVTGKFDDGEFLSDAVKGDEKLGLGVMAREIADLYSGVTDGITAGAERGSGENLSSQYYSSRLGEDEDEEDEVNYILPASLIGKTDREHFSGWEGDFVMSKDKKISKDDMYIVDGVDVRNEKEKGGQIGEVDAAKRLDNLGFSGADATEENEEDK